MAVGEPVTNRLPRALGAASATPLVDPAPPAWLAPRKVIIPDRPVGALDRPLLVSRCDLTRYRMTVLMAPGGFGKTVLMAECCRRAQADGSIVAWVSLDEHDDPDTLVGYIALAFAESGNDFELTEATSVPDPRRYRLDALLHWIGTTGTDVVIAFDEVDRLEPSSVAVLDYLTWRGPANLHVAMAFRSRPRGLDISTPVVEGRGMVISIEDLRFEKQDIARYFDTSLSREQLRSLWDESNGWPFAVCVQRNVADRFRSSGAFAELSLNWVETRLLRGLTPSDRHFVLEVGLFEWADEELLDRVLKQGASRRLRSLTQLVGLVQQVADGSFRLHSLLRRYASDTLWRDARQRFRSVHRRIALVLGERGHVVEAMQHAREAADPRLAGRILERAGGIRVGIRDGWYRLRQAHGLVEAAVMRRSPRLALVDCGVLAISGKVEQAMRVFADLNEQAASQGNNRPASYHRDLQVDLGLARAIFEISGCGHIGAPAERAAAADIAELAQDETVDPIVRAAALFGQALLAYEAADFASAAALAHRVRSTVQKTSRYLVMCADFLVAGIHVARGETDDAETLFSQALRIAKKDFAYDTSPLVVCDVLVAELNLERNRTASMQQRIHSAAELATASAWMGVFVAATDTSAEEVARSGAGRILPVYEKALTFARETMRPRLVRCMAALMVSSLVRMGRLAEAHDVWQAESLPVDAKACVDLEDQSWREMECIATARVRLLAASGDVHKARSLGSSFATAARNHGLVRSLTYANAGSVYAAWAAGRVDGARDHVLENLALYERTGYCRAMLWHPESTTAALRALGEDIEPDVAAAKDALLFLMASDADAAPELTVRELEVLARLDHSRDKEIARELGLTDNGVRYHVRNIFRKLGVTDRRAAVAQARMLGLPSSPDGLDLAD